MRCESAVLEHIYVGDEEFDDNFGRIIASGAVVFSSRFYGVRCAHAARRTHCTAQQLLPNHETSFHLASIALHCLKLVDGIVRRSSVNRSICA